MYPRVTSVCPRHWVNPILDNPSRRRLAALGVRRRAWVRLSGASVVSLALPVAGQGQVSGGLVHGHPGAAADRTGGVGELAVMALQAGAALALAPPDGAGP